MQNFTIPEDWISNLSILITACSPLVLLALFFIPSTKANRHGERFNLLVSKLAAISFIGVIIAAVLFWAGGADNSGTLGASLLLPYLDGLSMTILLLVAFLVTIVTRYSIHYLAGDPAQGHFSKWLGITGGAIMMMIISGNLLIFAIAWVATSLSLHQLLTFYGHRSAARYAATKKFIISRIGDLCIIGVLVLIWQSFGTWQFEEIFAKVENLSAGEASPAPIGWISVLLVIGAMLKSAQFPFHTWLPDTMETPTPVSALMHAGIINAGGFLIIRFSPLVTLSPAALNALAAVGAFTALFGSLVMLTQTSIKRSLAYSTIAQMGFMMLQCGLGAFSLAVLHIVAHSLYKAHAFLSSGSIVQMQKAAWVPLERPSTHPLVLIVTLFTSVALTTGIGSLFGISLTNDSGVWLLATIFTMAATYLLWNLWATSKRISSISLGFLITSVVATCYFTLHAGAKALLANSLPSYAPVRAPWEYGVMLIVALLFLVVLVFQAQLPAWSSSRLAKKFYVHAANGFHLGENITHWIRAYSKKSNA